MFFFKKKNKVIDIRDNRENEQKNDEVEEIKVKEKKNSISKVPDELIAEALKSVLAKDKK